ncbi:MAG TPA: hypothetical protein VN641_08315 [Urbifossiella sp.]|nr:hypothetical protein [Urbifossiella sp.]
MQPPQRPAGRTDYELTPMRPDREHNDRWGLDSPADRPDRAVTLRDRAH